jgi:N-acetylmuramoyl-L-alanine amidase
MAQNPSSDRMVTIEGIELQQDGSQLLIQSNQPFTYTSEWDRASGAYRIVIPSAQLGNGVQPPQSTNRGAFLWVKLQQEDPQTVAILVQPAAGVRIGPLTQPSPQLLSVTLQRPGNVASAPNSRTSVPTAPAPMSYPAPSPMRSRDGRRVVVIDAGHGGRDPGAVGIGGLQEKGVVMDISNQVARLLEQNGVQVVMTRQDDREIDLAPRVQLANRVNADIFVSIHANAIDMSRPDVNGIETYYYSSGLRLAQTIHNSLLQGTGARDRRVRQARFYVLRHTSMPAVLLEVGFVTGAEDAPRLANAAYRTQLAQSIAQGILQYLQNP